VLLGLTLATVAARADDEPNPTPSAEATAESAAPEKPHIITRLPHGRRPPVTTEAVLAERIRLLTLELDLTEPQQKAVREILIQHGEAIRRVWQDHSLTEGERVPITGAIGEKTADAIRDLLTPKQREKYNPPRPNIERQQRDGARDLGKYLDAINRK
jgi:hypothetical protein